MIDNISEMVQDRDVVTMCLHINWKVHAACDLNIIVKREGVYRVTEK